MTLRRSGPSATRRIAAFADGIRHAPRGEKTYALVTLVDSAGTGLFLSASAVIFLRLVLVTPRQAATALSLAAAAGMLMTVPAGWIGDRTGHRRALIVVHTLRGLVFPMYLLVSSYSGLIVVAVVVGMLDASEGPLRGAYLASVVPEERRVRASAINRVVFNVGFSLGAFSTVLALGLPGKLGYQVLVLGNSLSFLGAAVLVSRIPESPHALVRGRASNSGSAARNPAFIGAALLGGLLNAHAQLLTVGLPLWLVARTKAPVALVGVTFLLNTLLVVMFQVRASRNSEGLRGVARADLLGGVWLLGGCLAAAWTGHLGRTSTIVALVASVSLLTFGELFVSVGSWGAPYALAPPDRQGEYQGVWRLGGQAVQVLAPAAFTYMLFTLGATGWLVLGLGFLAAGILLRPVLHMASRRIEASYSDDSHISGLEAPQKGIQP